MGLFVLKSVFANEYTIVSSDIRHFLKARFLL